MFLRLGLAFNTALKPTPNRTAVCRGLALHLRQ